MCDHQVVQWQLSRRVPECLLVNATRQCEGSNYTGQYDHAYSHTEYADTPSHPGVDSKLAKPLGTGFEVTKIVSF